MYISKGPGSGSTCRIDVTCTLTPDPCASIDEQKRAIKPDGRHQVQAELLLPLVVTRRGKATGGRARRASTFTTMAMPARRVSSRSKLMAKFAVG